MQIIGKQDCRSIMGTTIAHQKQGKLTVVEHENGNDIESTETQL